MFAPLKKNSVFELKQADFCMLYKTNLYVIYDSKLEVKKINQKLYIWEMCSIKRKCLWNCNLTFYYIKEFRYSVFFMNVKFSIL